MSEKTDNQYGHLISQDMERCVLGSILLDSAKLAEVAGALKVEDFALDSHRRIYRAMLEMSIGIDVATLAQKLIDIKEIEAIGGVSYLSSLTDGMPRVANIDHYVNIVKDKSLSRRFLNSLNNSFVACMDGSEKLSDLVGRLSDDLLDIGKASYGGKIYKFQEAFSESFNSLDDLHSRGKGNTGSLETGFREFDELTTGLANADMIVVAGRPSMGKTSFALDIARWVAVHDKKPVLIFSLEMSRSALVLRLLCAEADVDSHRLKTGFANREDWTKLALALGRLNDAPIYIEDSAAQSVTEMRSKALRFKAEHDLALTIIDYLQLMHADDQESRTQEVSYISRGIKAMAKELDRPVIAISQLKRPQSGKEGKPQLSDLRESGQIEQDADLVAFLYREEMVNPTEENRGRAEAIIAKQRNGPTGTVNLVFLPQYTSFRNPPEAFGPEDNSGTLWA